MIVVTIRAEQTVDASDDDFRKDIISKLKEQGVIGVPTASELQDALRDMWSENPDGIFELSELSENDLTFICTQSDLNQLEVEEDELEVEDEGEDDENVEETSDGETTDTDKTAVDSPLTKSE